MIKGDPRLTYERRLISRLLLTLRDFQLALSSVTFLSQETDWDEQYNYVARRRLHCFETAFIIAYARPFSQSRGEIKSFAWKHIEISLSDAEKTLHDRLLSLRNKVIAHSDSDHVEIFPTILKFTGIDGRTDLDFGRAEFRDGLDLAENDYLVAERLLMRAINLLHQQVNKLKDKAPELFRVVEIDVSSSTMDDAKN